MVAGAFGKRHAFCSKLSGGRGGQPAYKFKRLERLEEVLLVDYFGLGFDVVGAEVDYIAGLLRYVAGGCYFGHECVQIRAWSWR